MKQTFLTALIVIVTLALLSIVISGSISKGTVLVPPEQKSEQPTTTVLKKAEGLPIFFYGNTCPHCKDVEEWMVENKIEEKMNISKKEVYENKGNANELEIAAKSCGLDTNSIGVPFLYAEGKCFVGSPDVIGYISSKVEINLEERSN